MTVTESITAYVTSVTAAFDAIDAANTSATASAASLVTDIKFIADALAAIQNSPGTLSIADQKSLDDAQARVAVVVTNSQAVAASLKALDAANTPPPPPVVVPAPAARA